MWGYKPRALAVSIDSPGGYSSQAELVTNLLGEIREK